MENISTLRSHLFYALKKLQDCEQDEIDLEVTRCASIVQVAESLIKTVEAESRFIAITKGMGSGFISNEDASDEIFDVDKEKNWVANDGIMIADQSPITKPLKLAHGGK